MRINLNKRGRVAAGPWGMSRGGTLKHDRIDENDENDSWIDGAAWDDAGGCGDFGRVGGADGQDGEEVGDV